MEIKEKFKYNKKAVSLISLVVTIVVLLILAGISTNMLIGENGILEKVTEAKTITDESQEKELISIAVAEARIGNNGYEELTQNNLQNAIDNQFGIGKTLVTDSRNGTFIVSSIESGRSYNIDSTGKIEKSEIVTADSILVEDYGVYVTNYTPKSTITSNVGWRIFYSDESNIYLIADNYIETSNLPSSTKNGEKTGNVPLVGNLIKTASFTNNILEDYEGIASITTSNPTYKWLKQYHSRTDVNNITNNNIKSTAYMLDTAAWSDFASDKAEYAVGAPTLELFVASYNAKHPNTLIYTEASSSIGYQIKGGPKNKEEFTIAMGLGDETEDLWIIKSNNEAYGMWLASPSHQSPEYNMYTFYSGYITTATYNNEWLGFRPIICLKSNIELIKSQDKTGTIAYVIK